jgi:hypothetical protein
MKKAFWSVHLTCSPFHRAQSDTTSEISCLYFRVLGVMDFHNIHVVRGSFANCVGPRNMSVYLWLKGPCSDTVKRGEGELSEHGNVRWRCFL